MTDPYNSHGSSFAPVTPAAQAAAAAARPRDNITRLDVSESWKRRFRLIEQAGGPDLPQFRNLAFGERFSIHFNILGLLLGPIYYIAKGLWRQAVAYFIIAFVLILVMEAMGLGKFTRGIGTGVGAVYSLRANVSYYKLKVQGEAPWF